MSSNRLALAVLAPVTAALVKHRDGAPAASPAQPDPRVDAPPAAGGPGTSAAGPAGSDDA